MEDAQVPVNTSTDSAQNPPSRNPISNQKGNVPIILGVVLLLLIIGGATYYLGTQRSKEMPSNQQSANQTQANPTIAPEDQAVGDYIKYQHKMFHLGYPVFEVEVPSDWSAYTVYGKRIYSDPAIIYLGKAQNKTSGRLLHDLIPTIRIVIVKNKQLASLDPKQWSSDNRAELFDGSPLPEDDWENILVNNMNAKKITVPTIGNPKTVVYLVKDDVIFTLSYVGEGGDDTLLNQILSTFKIIDLQHL